MIQLNLDFSNYKPTNIELIEAFAQGKVKLPGIQGSVGNCASIALIKAAIEIFGLYAVFDLQQNNETYSVTFKNNHTVSFTDAELERSTYVADLIINASDPGKVALNKAIMDYANIALCAMVKRVMEIGEAGAGKNDFEQALIALNDGANTPTLPEKLGLENNYYGKKWYRNASGNGLIGWLKGHTVYISQGKRDDRGSVASDLFKYPKRMQIVDR
ncbi:hypothetical protein FIA58_004635 [Flavobacterium jejuense]|uniref:Uncharacterized protein n=1 Tax=Flavobacterium jejuense TaxID=1544455 RepID=A0ABX0IR53_9FLAO|nr:hypothetical protein [Flavobacterium jejuense]NHN24958.1 hypothetical protein [Flavobacterium jejuense]